LIINPSVRPQFQRVNTMRQLSLLFIFGVAILGSELTVVVNGFTASPDLSSSHRQNRQRISKSARCDIITSTFLNHIGDPKSRTCLNGWVQASNGEWEWEEDDPNFVPPPTITSKATPQLPTGKLRPKQSLGQNFLKDPNTVAKMIRAFHRDATLRMSDNGMLSIIELGPGAGALTDRLVEQYGTDVLQCIEVDPRAIEILGERHPSLVVHHADVLQVNYPAMAQKIGEEHGTIAPSLNIIGNLPYYITSQILFALADATHVVLDDDPHRNVIDSATVTMQWEVAQRMVAPTRCKDYGILSVVFQTYAESLQCHFKIPPTVFYPQPKVDSALIGIHFVTPHILQTRRLAGVRPSDFRTVVTTAFRQRRKTIRNSLKKLPHWNAPDLMDKLQSPPLSLPQSVVEAQEQGDAFALAQTLPEDWASKRPEELTPGQFVEVTRLLYGTASDGIEDYELGTKVWRKLKHGI
jgi:ribosomal RNA small subunit methyltransferase A